MKSLLLLAAALSITAAAAKNPVEVGHVVWTRDFDAALAAAAKTKKPVLGIFFFTLFFFKSIMCFAVIVLKIWSIVKSVLSYSFRSSVKICLGILIGI